MKNTCKSCELINNCIFDRRIKMFKKNCYIDDLALKFKREPEKLMKLLSKIESSSCIDIVGIISTIESKLDEWRESTKRRKTEYIFGYMIYFNALNKKSTENYAESPEKELLKYTRVLVALCDIIFNTDRNAEIVPCLRCGKPIENNKQRNRQYCDECKCQKGYTEKLMICPDCGQEFNADGRNNRQFRCYKCQSKADKIASRERSRRYRERKKLK